MVIMQYILAEMVRQEIELLGQREMWRY